MCRNRVIARIKSKLFGLHPTYLLVGNCAIFHRFIFVSGCVLEELENNHICFHTISNECNKNNNNGRCFAKNSTFPVVQSWTQCTYIYAMHVLEMMIFSPIEKTENVTFRLSILIKVVICLHYWCCAMLIFSPFSYACGIRLTAPSAAERV